MTKLDFTGPLEMKVEKDLFDTLDLNDIVVQIDHDVSWTTKLLLFAAVGILIVSIIIYFTTNPSGGGNDPKYPSKSTKHTISNPSRRNIRVSIPRNPADILNLK